MAALNADYHTTFAAELVKKVNEANISFYREPQLVHYKESTFPVLVRYDGFFIDEIKVTRYPEESNIVICTTLENFDGFVKDMKTIFRGPEGRHYVSVNWSNGTKESNRSMSVDNRNFHTILRMLEARPCADEVVVRARP